MGFSLLNNSGQGVLGWKHAAGNLKSARRGTPENWGFFDKNGDGYQVGFKPDKRHTNLRQKSGLVNASRGLGQG